MEHPDTSSHACASHREYSLQVSYYNLDVRCTRDFTPSAALDVSRLRMLDL